MKKTFLILLFFSSIIAISPKPLSLHGFLTYSETKLDLGNYENTIIRTNPYVYYFEAPEIIETQTKSLTTERLYLLDEKTKNAYFKELNDMFSNKYFANISNLKFIFNELKRLEPKKSTIVKISTKHETQEIPIEELMKYLRVVEYRINNNQPIIIDDTEQAIEYLKDFSKEEIEIKVREDTLKVTYLLSLPFSYEEIIKFKISTDLDILKLHLYETPFGYELRLAADVSDEVKKTKEYEYVDFKELKFSLEFKNKNEKIIVPIIIRNVGNTQLIKKEGGDKPIVDQNQVSPSLIEQMKKRITLEQDSSLQKVNQKCLDKASQIIDFTSKFIGKIQYSENSNYEKIIGAGREILQPARKDCSAFISAVMAHFNIPIFANNKKLTTKAMLGIKTYKWKKIPIATAVDDDFVKNNLIPGDIIIYQKNPVYNPFFILDLTEGHVSIYAGELAKKICKNCKYSATSIVIDESVYSGVNNENKHCTNNVCWRTLNHDPFNPILIIRAIPECIGTQKVT